MRVLSRFSGKLLRILSVAAIAMALWIATGGVIQPKRAPATDILSVPMERITYLFPTAASVDRQDQPEQASPVYDAQGALLGYVVATAPFSDEFVGYGGKVPMLVGLSPERKVTGIHVLANSETQSFLEGLREDGLFDQWNGLAPDEAAGKKVDAISEATLSSNAVIHGVQKRLALLSSKEATSVELDFKQVGGWIAGAIVVLLALASFFWPGKMKRVRVYLLALSVLVLGLWLGNFLSLSLFGNWLHNGVAWWVTPVLAALGLLGLLLPIVTDKSFYCVYVCPFGAVQELAGLASKKKWLPKGRLAKMLRLGPKVFLTVVIALLALGVSFDLADVEPFTAFMFSSASVHILVLAGVFAVLSVFVARPWCRYCCPTGEVMEILRRPVEPGGESAKATAGKQDGEKTKAGKQNEAGSKGEGMKLKDVIILLLALLVLAILVKPQAEEWVGKEVRCQGALAVLEGTVSARNFTGEPVSREVVDRMMKAALSVHMMRGKKPCDVWVTQERARMDAVGEALGSDEKQVIQNASALVVVVGMPAKGAGGETGYWQQNCGAATQALLYSAAAQDAGATWFGVAPDEELTKKVSAALELPDFAVPVSVVPVGVPLKAEAAHEGVDLTKVHWNLW